MNMLSSVETERRTRTLSAINEALNVRAELDRFERLLIRRRAENTELIKGLAIKFQYWNELSGSDTESITSVRNLIDELSSNVAGKDNFRNRRSIDVSGDSEDSGSDSAEDDHSFASAANIPSILLSKPIKNDKMEAVIGSLIADFEFTRVHQHMIAAGWKVCLPTGRGIPSVEYLQERAEEILRTILVIGYGTISVMGFCASVADVGADKPLVKLSWEVTSAEVWADGTPYI